MFDVVHDLGNPERPAADIFLDDVSLPDACSDSEALPVHMHCFTCMFVSLLFATFPGLIFRNLPMLRFLHVERVHGAVELADG